MVSCIFVWFDLVGVVWFAVLGTVTVCVCSMAISISSRCLCRAIVLEPFVFSVALTLCLHLKGTIGITEAKWHLLLPGSAQLGSIFSYVSNLQPVVMKIINLKY